MPKFTPEIDKAAEFLEISSDFGDPREIIREAISNSFDAKAKIISVTAVIDKSKGVDELVVILEDNGEGMNEDQLRKFFGLGFSRGRLTDNLGTKISKNIGEKGHGTKIYFNSRRIEVETTQAGKHIKSFLDNPKANLRVGKLPEVEYNMTDTTLSSNTKIIVRGYNDNNQVGFSHNELKDYI
jgi:signal transduction histidine kinase